MFSADQMHVTYTYKHTNSAVEIAHRMCFLPYRKIKACIPLFLPSPVCLSCSADSYSKP